MSFCDALLTAFSCDTAFLAAHPLPVLVLVCRVAGWHTAMTHTARRATAVLLPLTIRSRYMTRTSPTRVLVATTRTYGCALPHTLDLPLTLFLPTCHCCSSVHACSSSVRFGFCARGAGRNACAHTGVTAVLPLRAAGTDATPSSGLHPLHTPARFARHRVRSFGRVCRDTTWPPRSGFTKHTSPDAPPAYNTSHPLPLPLRSSLYSACSLL